MKAIFEGCCDGGAVHTQVADAFDDAAGWFVKVSAHAVGRYDEPGLGEWSVRDLLGHTSRSLSTVETHLDVALTDSGPVELADALADSAATVERGRAAGAALGEDPMLALGALVARVPARVRATPAGALVRTPFGMMTLEAYLPTRTLELTVHTCDLAAAPGVSADVPRAAAADTFAVVGGLAATQGRASAALLALTGRRALTAGYSMWSTLSRSMRATSATPICCVSASTGGRASKQ